MRTVIVTGSGRVELNYMWLPTFIGLNAVLKAEMEKSLQGKILGLPIDDVGLDRVNEIVIDFLVKKFPEIKGLADYLDGLKFVEV